MLSGLIGAASGLTLPTLHTPRPYFPLDTISLTLTREAFEALGNGDGERRNLGLLCVPVARGGGGTEPDPAGLCGVIAEISSCSLALDSDRVLVRGVAFARFRTRRTPGEAAARSLSSYSVAAASPAELSMYEVEPWRDAPPEEDELEASERRCHLLFRQVEQLLQWAGDEVAVSGRAAVMGEEERVETHRAVHRFAPVRGERAAWRAAEDECARSDECSVGGEADKCLLERAYLHGAVAHPAEASSHAEVELAEFVCGRQELYSFALARLFDISPVEAQPILAGRSGAARLATAEENLSSTSAWLSGRIGLGGGLGAGGDAVDAAPYASERLLYSGRVVPTARAAAGGAGAPYKVGTRPPGSGLLSALVNAGKVWQMLPRR